MFRYAGSALIALFIATNPAFAEDKGLSVETATIQIASDEFTEYSSSIQVALRNDSPQPVQVVGVVLDRNRYLDMQTFLERPLGGAPVEPKEIPTRGKKPGQKSFEIPPVGTLFWHRVQPNPIPPSEVGELTIRLARKVEHAALVLELSNGAKLPVAVSPAEEVLHLSHIAFDPLDPNVIYVYCRNNGKKNISVDYMQVGAERVKDFKSIPSGNLVKAGEKSCFFVKTSTEKIKWGRYIGVGMVGKTEEQTAADTAAVPQPPPAETAVKAFSVVRAENFFSIGAWDFDMRPELFFDSEDIKGQNRGEARARPEAPPKGKRPWRAYKVIGDISEEADRAVACRTVLKEAAQSAETDGPAIYTDILGADTAYNPGCFGGLGDFLLVCSYRVRRSGPIICSQDLASSRPWLDPRPYMSNAECFTTSAKALWDRDVTPEELRCDTMLRVFEGTKGISYYRRNAQGAEVKGYGDIPALEREIGRVNLDLQLLKPFLRIGDTYHDCISAGTVSPGHQPRAILCGDKAVCFAILAPFTGEGTKGSNLKWNVGRSYKEVKITTRAGKQITSHLPIMTPELTLPAGASPGRLFKVEQGMTEIPYTTEGNKITFDTGLFNVMGTFVLTINEDAGAKGPEVPQAVMDSTTPQTILSEYKKKLAPIMVDMLDPWSDIPLEKSIQTGLAAGGLRKAALDKLLALKANPPEGVEPASIDAALEELAFVKAPANAPARPVTMVEPPK